MVNKVAVVNVGNNVDEAVRNAINLVGGFSPIDNSTIAIKPNLCSAMPPESGVTTDVRVVEGLIRYLTSKNKRLRILLIESNSDYIADTTFRKLGYEELVKKYGITLCNLSKDKRIRIEIPEGKKIIYLEIPETLLYIDYLISVAKLKTHGFERFSGVWKNQFGLMPRKSSRPRLHPFLSKVLYDLNSVFYPSLSLIDGITALEGVGPLEGKPRKMDVIICSNDPLSADITAARLIGFNHYKIPHIKYALKHGFEESEGILVVGDAGIDTIENRFEFISWFQYFIYRISLFFGRMGRYLENIGDVIFTSVYALRTTGFKQLATGRMFSIKKIIHEIISLIFKLEC